MKNTTHPFLSALFLGLMAFSTPAALARSPAAVRCSANCGFFFGWNGATLVSVPLFADAATREEGLAQLKQQCSARNPQGILYSAIQYVNGAQRLVPVDTYSDIDLNAWVCTDLPAVAK